jgi:hypothetical protein
MGLDAGSIIQPGNWGRVLRLYETPSGQGLPTNVFREALLEQARMIYAPTKPSRLECVFVVPTHAEAIKFRDKHQKTSLIYEVTPTVDNIATHVGDYELVFVNYPVRYFESMFDYARDYWTATNPANPEILLSCSVQILRRL